VSTSRNGPLESASGSRAACRPTGFSACTRAIGPDDEEAGRQARDDLVAQPLRRFRARGEHLLAQLEPGQRLFHGGRHERRLGAGLVASLPAHVARRGERAQQRERERPAIAPTIAVSPSMR
jgi:hypothetical protein